MMEHFTRKERLAVLAAELSARSNQILTFSRFCERFETAKSSMSEDIGILRKVFSYFGLGSVETVTGAGGGVRFRSGISGNEALQFVESLCRELEDASRLLPGGYLYSSDILGNPTMLRTMGVIIANAFYEAAPDFVLTMETKGIPVATMTAQSLGIPLIIARRQSKVYEGPAVSINYVSGSAERIETMCLSRRAVKPGQRALLVDDFLKAGGTAKGMIDLMSEFNAEVIGSAFVIAKEHIGSRLIQGEKALMTMRMNENGQVSLTPGDWIQG